MEDVIMNLRDIEGLKSRDEAVFNRFYDKYNKLFFSVIYRTVQDFSITEELVSDVFCKILECLDQYKGGNFKYWCMTICKNIANMHLRKIIREKEKLKEWSENFVIETSLAEEEDIQNQLLADINKLVDVATYEIIILHLVQNLKFKEIAETRNETISSVLGRYHRGIRSKLNYENIDKKIIREYHEEQKNRIKSKVGIKSENSCGNINKRPKTRLFIPSLGFLCMSFILLIVASITNMLHTFTCSNGYSKTIFHSYDS